MYVQKKNITPFIHGMCFMKTQFFDMYSSQLEIANEKGDAKEIFELKIKANATMEKKEIEEEQELQESLKKSAYRKLKKISYFKKY